MELRNTETEIQSLTELYGTIQLRFTQYCKDQSKKSDQSIITSIQLPLLLIQEDSSSTNDPTTDVNNNNINHNAASIVSTSKTTMTTTTERPTTTTTTATELYNALKLFQQRMITLHTIIIKFHQRLYLQMDPITNAPRYGIQTQQRVQTMIHKYELLLQVYNTIYVSSSSDDDNNNESSSNILQLPSSQTVTTTVLTSSSSPPPTTTTTEKTATNVTTTDTNNHHFYDPDTTSSCSTIHNNIVTYMVRMAEMERLEQEQHQQLVETEHQQILLQAQEERRQEHEREQEARRITYEKEQEILRQQSEHYKQQRNIRLQELEQKKNIERSFIQNIPNRNTLMGVQEQLHRFIQNFTNPPPNNNNNESTTTSSSSSSSSSSSLKVSLQSLHRLYQQIVQHPDNESYRRIRRDHTQFIQDIGQYTGGIELLICSGFSMGIIDNTIPSYICKEPNIETDFDAWSKWYDLLKGTTELIEQEMNQHNIKKLNLQ